MQPTENHTANVTNGIPRDDSLSVEDQKQFENHFRSMSLPDGTDLVSRMLTFNYKAPLSFNITLCRKTVLHRDSDIETRSQAHVETATTSIGPLCYTAFISTGRLVEEREVCVHV